MAADISDADSSGRVPSFDNAGGPSLSGTKFQDIVSAGKIGLVDSEEVEQNPCLGCFVDEIFERVGLRGFKRGVSPKIDFTALACGEVVRMHADAKSRVDRARCILCVP